MDIHLIFYLSSVMVGIAGLFFVISQSIVFHFKWRSQAEQNATFRHRFDGMEIKMEDIVSKVNEIKRIEKEREMQEFETRHMRKKIIQNPKDDGN